MPTLKTRTRPTASSSAFAVRAKKRLLDQGRTIADVARELGCARESVSRAIHTDGLPRLRERVRAALSI